MLHVDSAIFRSQLSWPPSLQRWPLTGMRDCDLAVSTALQLIAKITKVVCPVNKPLWLDKGSQIPLIGCDRAGILHRDWAFLSVNTGGNSIRDWTDTSTTAPLSSVITTEGELPAHLNAKKGARLWPSGERRWKCCWDWVRRVGRKLSSFQNETGHTVEYLWPTTHEKTFQLPKACLVSPRCVVPADVWVHVLGKLHIYFIAHIECVGGS